MALYYPDINKHNNPTLPFTNQDEICGGYWQVADKTARNNISLEKRTKGMGVAYYVSGILNKKIYDGADLTDINWQNDDNWYDSNFVKNAVPGNIATFNTKGEIVDSGVIGNYTAGSGIGISNGTISLGGSITTDSHLGLNDTILSIGDSQSYNVVFGDGSNNFLLRVQAGGQSVTMNNKIGSLGNGLIYGNDYSAYFVDRSLVDKAYVDSKVSSFAIQSDWNVTNTDSLAFIKNKPTITNNEVLLGESFYWRNVLGTTNVGDIRWMSVGTSTYLQTYVDGIWEDRLTINWTDGTILTIIDPLGYDIELGGGGSGSGTNAVWGNITGSITEQVDLIGLVDTKQDFITPGISSSYYYSGNKTWVQFPTALPASDVYSWAKSSTKPVYNTTEVTESTNLYFTQSRALASVLTGFTTGTELSNIISTDTILQALQKLDYDITYLNTNKLNSADIPTNLSDLYDDVYMLTGRGVVKRIPYFSNASTVIATADLMYDSTTNTFSVGNSTTTSNGNLVLAGTETGIGTIYSYYSLLLQSNNIILSTNSIDRINIDNDGLINIFSNISSSGTITASNLSGTNTGDETNSTIINKLGYTPADQLYTYTKTETNDTFEYKLPSTPVNPETKFLNGNRTWSDIAIGGGGYAANIYFTVNNSDVSGYYKASYTLPSTETVLSSIINNQEILLRTYLYDTAIGVTLIDAGNWVASFTAKVSTNTGVTNLKAEVFLRAANGTETTLFSAYSPELNNTDYLVIKTETNQQSFSCNTTDRLGVRVYAKTTSNANVTVSSIVGNGRASYFNAPLKLRHNQLRDLNGDSNYLHITSAQNTTLNNQSGTNTGDETNATIVSKLGTNLSIKLDKTLTQNYAFIGNSFNVAAEMPVLDEWVVGASSPGQKEVKGLVTEMIINDGSIIAIPIVFHKTLTLTSTGTTALLMASYSGRYYIIESISIIARSVSVSQYPIFSIGCNSTSYNNIVASTTLSTLTNGINVLTLTTNAPKALIQANTTMYFNLTQAILGSGSYEIVIKGYLSNI